ncbi:MAG: hypothetical protein OXF27_01515, partial [Acidobacteria bacterium]|nr:hypothetical protein [Acidobacteriota bacterium]
RAVRPLPRRRLASAALRPPDAAAPCAAPGRWAPAARPLAVRLRCAHCPPRAPLPAPGELARSYEAADGPRAAHWPCARYLPRAPVPAHGVMAHAAIRQVSGAKARAGARAV